jgi:PTH2 family peptidyl-tRNA hydrolase
MDDAFSEDNLDVNFDPVEQAEPDETDSESEETWWNHQIYTLLIGVICGLVANFLIRHYSSINNAGRDHQAGNMGNRAMVPSAAAIRTFSTNNKMVLVVRNDLQMGRGKAASQCAHAALMCYKKALKVTPQLVKQWEVFGQAKVALKAESEDALMELKARAESEGLVACLVADAGRTQVEAGTFTVLGIGPGPAEVVDKVTGHLKLY